MVKKILYGLLILFIIGAGIAFWGYQQIFVPNTSFDEEVKVIQIPRGSSFELVKETFLNDSILSDISSFERVAGWMNYNREQVPSGNYELKKDWSNREIVSALRSGIQKPKKVTFNNVRTMEELMGPLSKDINLDSSQLVQYFSDPQLLSNLGFTKESILSLFIPNTYQIYWDISLEELTSKMQSEYKTFWNQNDRKTKAEALEMTPSEVYTLASIVEKESQHGPERPTIAGLYLNRLNRGIPLQADPTVVFATGNFELRRVLNKHLAIDSPYNTYKYQGLPPGPIYMPSIQSIDAVLNYEKHEYLFMCAKPGYGTQHAFAKTLRGHNKNAKEYQSWLNQQGIK